MCTWLKQCLLSLTFIWATYLVSPTTGYFGLTSKEPLLALTLRLGEEARDVVHGGGGGGGPVDDGVSAGRDTPRDSGPGRHRTTRICDLLKLPRKQRRTCKRVRGVGETLVAATRIATAECQHQFRYERWNCSLGQQRINILKRGFKETSFMYAVSSAGLVHAFSRACSQGKLDRCTCDESFNDHKNRQAWLWGGCGDNIRFGHKFTRRFLKMVTSKSAKDLRATMNIHNTRLGMKTVRDGVRNNCKCHGVSGSCTVKTCWRQLTHFHDIGSKLKNKYERAHKVVTYTNEATSKYQMRENKKNTVENNAKPQSKFKSGDLLYTEESPSFCRKSRLSHGTAGRLCKKDDNCDTICCGRGYNVQRTSVTKPCHCEVIWCCEVKCKRCQTWQELYLCK